MVSTGVEGYFKGQTTADTKQFPPGDYEYRVIIDVPDSAGETLQGKFQVVRSDLEMDDTKPNFAASLAMASDFDETVQSRLSSKTKADLAARLPREGTTQKLAFKLSDKELLRLIPECCPERAPDRQDIRGPVHDLWDKNIEFPEKKEDGNFWERNVPTSWASRSIPVSWVMLTVIALLCVEWLTRKLLRLA
jgi:hypothetical protein